jgi:hypothetical protein
LKQKDTPPTQYIGEALLVRIEQVEVKINEVQQAEITRNIQFKQVAEARRAKEAAALKPEIKEVSYENMNEFIIEAGNNPSILKEKSGKNEKMITYFSDNLNSDKISANF